MKKARKVPADEPRSEYSRSDFGTLVRGKYIERLRERSNVVVLDPEIADLFPNGASVNAALQALADIAKRTGPPRRRR
jgi:adenine/guanine phosphoribosyltransferase-like PRPP-binding protein